MSMYSINTPILATPTMNDAAIPVPAKIEFTDVTIYLKGGFGNIVRVDARELTIETGIRYAQYPYAVRVTYKAQRQRKARGVMLTYNPFLVVVSRANAVEPDDMFGAATTDETTGVEVKKSVYSSFDDRFASDFEAKLGNRPRLVSIVGRLPHPADHLTVGLK